MVRLAATPALEETVPSLPVIARDRVGNWASHPLAPARGLLLGLSLGITAWVIIGAVVAAVW